MKTTRRDFLKSAGAEGAAANILDRFNDEWEGSEDLVDDAAPELCETNQALTKAAKRVMLEAEAQDSTDALNDFIAAAKRSGETLRQQYEKFHTLNGEAALQDYADAVGRDRGALTETEKRQALFNHILDQSETSDYIKMLNDPSITRIPAELQPEQPPGTCLVWPESDGDAPDGWTLIDDGMRHIRKDV